jgi:hypothetical protein
MAADGSRWQFLGRALSSIAQRDTIDNDLSKRRFVTPGGRGATIPAQIAPILERLGVIAEGWVESVRQLGRRLKTAAGRRASIVALPVRWGKAWFQGQGASALSYRSSARSSQTERFRGTVVSLTSRRASTSAPIWSAITLEAQSRAGPSMSSRPQQPDARGSSLRQRREPA